MQVVLVLDALGVYYGYDSYAELLRSGAPAFIFVIKV